jgi:hypothetical protein
MVGLLCTAVLFGILCVLFFCHRSPEVQGAGTESESCVANVPSNGPVGGGTGVPPVAETEEAHRNAVSSSEGPSGAGKASVSADDVGQERGRRVPLGSARELLNKNLSQANWLGMSNYPPSSWSAIGEISRQRAVLAASMVGDRANADFWQNARPNGVPRSGRMLCPPLFRPSFYKSSQGPESVPVFKAIAMEVELTSELHRRTAYVAMAQFATTACLSRCFWDELDVAEPPERAPGQVIANPFETLAENTRNEVLQLFALLREHPNAYALCDIVRERYAVFEALKLLEQHPLRTHLDHICLEIDLLVILGSGDDPKGCVARIAKRRARLHKESDSARDFQEQLFIAEKHRWEVFVSWVRLWHQSVAVASSGLRLPRE